MALYNDLKENNKNNKSNQLKKIVFNQKALNIIIFSLFTVLLLTDIIYVFKENNIGILPFSFVVIIIAIILEGILLIVNGIFRFDNNFFKYLKLVVFAIPLIAYIPMMVIDDKFSVALFIIRIIVLLSLLIFVIKNVNKNLSVYKSKQVAYSIVSVTILVVSLVFLFQSQNRRIIYKYDSSKGGYVLEEVLRGNTKIEVKEGVVDVSDDSLKYSDTTLTLPSSVNEVESNAFRGSNIDTIYVSSSYISLADAINNSKITTVYLTAPNTTITDFSNLVKEDVKFVTTKEDIDSYRDMYNYSTLFVPQVDDGEFYVMYNDSNINVEYYKYGDILEEKTDVSWNSSIEEVKFINWVYNSNSNKVSFPLTINDNLILKAIWDRVFVFNFDYSDGEIESESNLFSGKEEVVKLVKDDGELTLPTLIKSGYRFDGWYDSDIYNDDNASFITSILPDNFRNYNLKAKFSKKYYIDYNLNGGTIDESLVEEVVEGEDVTPLTPERKGYDFIGWYDNDKFDGDIVTSVSKEGTSLYAKWELKKPIITLSNDIDMVYGSEASISVLSVTHDLVKNFSYEWYKEGNDTAVSSQKDYVVDEVADSGSYYCIISFTIDNTDYDFRSDNVNVKIAKATYDMSNVSFMAENGTVNEDGTFVFEYNGDTQYPTIKTDTLPSGVSVSYTGNMYAKVGYSGTITAVFSTTSNNYEVPKSMTAEYQIVQRKIAVTFSVSDLVYDGSEKQITYTIDNLVSEDDSLTLDIDFRNKTGDDFKVINAGTYTVYVKGLSGNKNYALASNDYEFTIESAEYDLSTVNIPDITYTYDKTAKTPDYSYLPSDLVPSISTELINAGTYNDIEVSFTCTNPNYVVTGTLYANVIIEKKVIGITWSNTNLTYNGETQTPKATATGVISGDEVSITITNNSKNAGSYIAQILVDNSNYKYESGYSYSYTIKKCELTVEWSNITSVYNGNIQHPTASVNSLYDEVEVIVKEVNGNEMKNASTYDVIASTSNTNYSLINATNTFTINKYDLDGIIWSNDEFVYNSESQIPTAKVETFEGDITVNVTTSGDTINVGTYTAIASFESTSNYTFSGEKETIITITKATFDVGYTIYDKEYVYDGNTHLPSVSATLVTTDYGDNITYVFAEGVKTAGTHNVSITFSAGANYNDVTLYGKVTITKRNLTISLDDSSLVYNNTLQYPTVTFTNNVSGDDITVSVKTANSVAAKTYSVSPTDFAISGADSSNYTIEETYSYEIHKATFDMSKVIYSNLEVTYNGKVQYPTITNPYTELEYTIENGIKDATTSGAVTISFTPSSNYNSVSDVTVYMVVNAKEVSITFTDLEIGYDGKSHTPGYTAVGAYSGDDIEAVIVVAEGEAINRGSYNASISSLENSNYTLKESVTTTFEIVAGTYDMSSITFDDQSYTYDGFEHSIKIKGTLPTGGDGVQVSVSYSTDTAKYVTDGKVLVVATFTGTDNYNAIPEMEAYVSITAKEITIIWTGLNATYVYNNTYQMPSATASSLLDGDTCDLTLESDGLNAGTRTVSVISLSNPNYKLPEEYSAEFTISKAEYDMSISFNDIEVEYTGTKQYPLISGNIEDVVGLDSTSPRVKEYDGYAIDVSDGKVAVVVSFETDSENYNAPESMTAYVTILPKGLDVELTSDVTLSQSDNTYSFTYDGSEHSINVSYDKSDLIGSDTLEITLSDTFKNAGTYELNPTFSNTNYGLSSTITIKVVTLYIWWVSWNTSGLYPTPNDTTANGNSINPLDLDEVYVAYYDSDDNLLDEAPVEGGSYTAKLMSSNTDNVYVSNLYVSFNFPYSVGELYWSDGDEVYTNKIFSITGNTATGTSIRYYGTTYNSYLKMEKETVISFTTYYETTLTLIFNRANSLKVKVDGESYDITTLSSFYNQCGYVTVTLSAGTHTITKDTTNTYLYYVSLA